MEGRKSRPFRVIVCIELTRASGPAAVRLHRSSTVAISLSVERLWAFADGTICVIVEREDEPRYEVCVMRGERVLHQDRLSFRAAAHLRSQTWRAALQPAPQVTH